MMAVFGSATPQFVSLWLPTTLLTGVGVGLLLPTLSAAAVSGLPPERFGVGSAANQAIRQLGSALGVALVIAFLAAATPTTGLLAFERIFWLLVVGGVLTSAVCLGIKGRSIAVPRPAIIPE